MSESLRERLAVLEASIFKPFLHWTMTSPTRVENTVTSPYGLAFVVRFTVAPTDAAEAPERPEDLVKWFRRHLLCRDVEIKTIGTHFFDPREHCSGCRQDFKRGVKP